MATSSESAEERKLWKALLSMRTGIAPFENNSDRQQFTFPNSKLLT